MPRTIYVEIPRKVGDYRVDTGGASFLENVGAGTSLGTAIGSVFPGAGNAIGAGAGAIIGSVASLFGFRSGRDEVRDVMRKILLNAFGGLMPGRVGVTGGARDVPVLQDQFRVDDMRAVLRELKMITLAELKPGSDIYNDLQLAFNSLSFNTADDPGGYQVLQFQATTTSAGAGKTTGDDVLTPIDRDPVYGGDDRDPINRTDPSDANDPVPTSGRTGGAVLPLPVLAGAGALALLWLVGR